MALSTEDLQAISDMIQLAIKPDTSQPAPAPNTSQLDIESITEAFKAATTSQQEAAAQAALEQKKQLLDTMFQQALQQAIDTTPHLKDVLNAEDPIFGVTPLSRIEEMPDFEARQAALNRVIETTNQAASSASPLPIVSKRQQEEQRASDKAYAEAEAKILKEGDLTGGIESTFNKLMDELLTN